MKTELFPCEFAPDFTQIFGGNANVRGNQFQWQTLNKHWVRLGELNIPLLSCGT